MSSQISNAVIPDESLQSMNSLLDFATRKYSTQRDSQSKGRTRNESRRFYRGTTTNGDREVLIGEAELEGGNVANSHFTRVTIQGLLPLMPKNPVAHHSRPGFMHPFGICDGGSIDGAFTFALTADQYNLINGSMQDAYIENEEPRSMSACSAQQGQREIAYNTILNHAVIFKDMKRSNAPWKVENMRWGQGDRAKELEGSQLSNV